MEQTIFFNFGDIFKNKIFLITISVWAITQGIKVFIGIIEEKRFNFRWFIGTGGMPSSHAAGVTALAVSCGMQTGFKSPIFAVAAIFALITMFDAQGVRRATGQQAATLNKIIDDMYHHRFGAERLIELIGHTPLEVIMGFLLGVFLSICLYLKW